MIDDDVFATETDAEDEETTEDLGEELDLTELMEATTFRKT